MPYRLWLALTVLLVCPADLFAQDRLIVHEWGTFTSLQDEEGTTVGGINSDDEPVPRFVHDVSRMLIVGNLVQGAPRCHPDVTMRLETPVIYFHPPEKRSPSLVLDLSVEFKGGWLTQFYPKAAAEVDGRRAEDFTFQRLGKETIGKLVWKNVTVGKKGEKLHSAAQEWIAREMKQSRVWTSQQSVNAANIRNREGETERFLFYRGVGHIEAPLRVIQSASEQTLQIRGQLSADLKIHSKLTIRSLWFTEIREDGTSAFRTLPPATIIPGADTLLATTSGRFAEKDFRSGNIGELRKWMQKALVEEGLFPDEAQALLNTWELSYFKSPGTRLFFLVPAGWVDHYLPLQISLPVQLTRVMVGRLELITAKHRWMLREISSLPMPIPREKVLELYQKLGRFRGALILDEARKHPSETLTSFIQTFALQPYSPPP